MERYLRVNLLGRGPRLIKKNYRAVVPQSLRNAVLDRLSPPPPHFNSLDTEGAVPQRLMRPKHETGPSAACHAPVKSARSYNFCPPCFFTSSFFVKQRNKLNFLINRIDVHNNFGDRRYVTTVLELYLTFWRRNYFLILAHPVYKM